jgi:hypothetical protein
MLTSIAGWAMLLILIATTYVQIVGKQVELQSGADRLQHPDLYRHLFGGAPWIQWPMYRWSGFIQIGGIALTVWGFGWKTAVLLLVGLIVFGLFMMRVAKGHAAQMIADLGKTYDLDPSKTP